MRLNACGVATEFGIVCDCVTGHIFQHQYILVHFFLFSLQCKKPKSTQQFSC